MPGHDALEIAAVEEAFAELKAQHVENIMAEVTAAGEHQAKILAAAEVRHAEILREMEMRHAKRQRIEPEYGMEHFMAFVERKQAAIAAAEAVAAADRDILAKAQACITGKGA